MYYHFLFRFPGQILPHRSSASQSINTPRAVGLPPDPVDLRLSRPLAPVHLSHTLHLVQVCHCRLPIPEEEEGAGRQEKGSLICDTSNKKPAHDIAIHYTLSLYFLFIWLKCILSLITFEYQSNSSYKPVPHSGCHSLNKPRTAKF